MGSRVQQGAAKQFTTLNYISDFRKATYAKIDYIKPLTFQSRHAEGGVALFWISLQLAICDEVIYLD